MSRKTNSQFRCVNMSNNTENPPRGKVISSSLGRFSVANLQRAFHSYYTLGYYAWVLRSKQKHKKVPMFTHQDFKFLFTETYFSTHLGSQVIVVG